MKKIILSGFFPEYDCGLAMATIRSHLLADPLLANEAEILMKGFPVDAPAAEILKFYRDSSPDLLGFSCYVWNIAKTLDLCRRLRQAGCRIPIVLGGPEVSYTAAEILRENPGVSAIVCGEGEETFRELVRRHLKGEGFNGVPGVVARDGEKILENGPRAFLPDVNVIPSPFLDGSVDLGALGPIGLGCYESSRGCVYSCSFCVWGKVRSIRHYHLDRVEAELTAIMRSPAKRIWLADAVANLDKARFKKILRVILDKNKNKVLFDFEMVAELLDDESIELLSALPGGYIACGLQTTDPAALKNSQRFSDLTRFRRNIEKLRAKNSRVEIYLDLIYGLPGDSWRTYRKAVDYALAFVPDKIQTHPLMVLPGTHFYKEANRYGLIYDKAAPHYARHSGRFGPADFKKGAALTSTLAFYNSLFPIRLALTILQREGRDPVSEFEVFLSALARRSKLLENATLRQVLAALEEFAARTLGSLTDAKALLPVFADVSRYFVLLPAGAQLASRLSVGGAQGSPGREFGVERFDYDVEALGKSFFLDPGLDWGLVPRKETLFCFDPAATDEAYLRVVARAENLATVSALLTESARVV